MLVFTRQVGDSLTIGDDENRITLTITEIKRTRVKGQEKKETYIRVGVVAPKHMKIVRAESLSHAAPERKTPPKRG